MQLSYEDWKQQYKPIPNHLNPNASYDGLLFETYGDESAFITAQPQNAVWTLLDCDGKLVLGNGCHVVNRMGYVVTEVPVPEGVDIEVVDDDDDNPNENCLQGMACPACGDFGPFKILVSQSGMTRVSDEGTDSIEGDMEWDDDSPCECLECGHTGTVGQFKGQPDPEFDEFQQVVIESYNGGDHPAHAPGDIHDCGDTLLTFLLVELSKREDCDSFGCAVDRLDSAIRQLTEVRAAFEAKDLVSEPNLDQMPPVGQPVLAERVPHIQVEYDPLYTGGDYTGVGQFALVPISLIDACEKVTGAEDVVAMAFRKHTKLDSMHIIHYTKDEIYDQHGDLIETGVKPYCKAGEPA